jgi:hypothetical protein
MRRRAFLTAAAAASAGLPARVAAATPKKKVAALSTTYHVRSHSDNFITRFIEGYWIGDKYYEPPGQIVSLFMDQRHPADIGARLAAAHGFPVTSTIDKALTLDSGKLAVDAVLLVAEHGNYPHNDKNQQLYPRYEFFEQVVQVFKKSRKSCPVFTDKHLSYDWKKAKQMYDWSRELKFPLMAGSSVSVTFRRPELDPPLGADMEAALAVGGGWVADGGIFHILETMQAFGERRKGGETGVRAVQMLKGEDAWKAAEQGLWPKNLLQAALRRGQRVEKGRPEDVKNVVVGIVEYRDGFKGYVVALGSMVSEYLAAYKVKGKSEAEATLCYIPTENSNNFSPLVHAIAHMFDTGKHLYPVERTLLTTGVLSLLMESGYQNGKRMETPELSVSYKAPAKGYYAPGMGS